MEDEIENLFRIRKTVLEMLRDRGYLVLDPEMQMTLAEFRAKFAEGDHIKREDLSILKEKPEDDRDKIFVFYSDEPKLGAKNLKTYISRMKEENVSKAIIITQKNLTPYAKKAIAEFSSKFAVEPFQESELLVNITHHHLVPVHQLLNSEEKKAMLQHYALKERQLPRILVTDPIARYYGLKRGEVVKITRPSENAGSYETYRWVV
ncbi:DNA-directed RNA polymerases II 24 kDa polypeptide (RNA polymerase II subunit 5) [Asimina triloba]